MLQIISGKFFKSDERHSFEAHGILYSNYNFVTSIETCVATLVPVESYRSSVSSFVMNYTNQIEKDKVIVRVGDAEIVEQFQVLCMFGLRAFFHIDRHEVEINCRDKPRTPGDNYVPSKFVSRFFDNQIQGSKEEIEYFIRFMNKVIGLPRKKYEAIINCLTNFLHSLQILNYNFELAYSMLIYSLESLSQTFDGFEPEWNDYDQEIRKKLDICFSKMDDNTVEEIQSILLKSQNLRLQKRFLDFVTTHVSDTFFTEEATDLKFALRKSELKRSLKNAYSMRSKFTHTLLEMQEQLKVNQIVQEDVFHWDNEPYLTFNGLVRLTHHVINNFIWKQESLDIEDYNWRSALPGVVLYKLAPQYWIWKIDGFTPSQATNRLSGFLSQIGMIPISGKLELTDLSDLMELYKTLIPKAKKKDKIPMLALYNLYHMTGPEEDKKPEYIEFLNQYADIINECSIEMMVVFLISDRDWPWDIEKCVSTYLTHTENKYLKAKLSIPLLLDLTLIFEIANVYLRSKNIDKYTEWLDYAYFEAAGKPEIQSFIADCKSKEIEPDLQNMG